MKHGDIMTQREKIILYIYRLADCENLGATLYFLEGIIVFFSTFIDL
jgi:hypothetical protein